MSPSDFNLTRAAYSVNELLSILPLGRTSLYHAIKQGALKATKFGNKTIFLASDVAAFLGALPPIQNTDDSHARRIDAKA